MDRATSTVAMVLAHTIVLAPNHGASSRAAAISAPRLAMPTQNTTISSSGARLVVTRETYRPDHGRSVAAHMLANYVRKRVWAGFGQQRRGSGAGRTWRGRSVVARLA